VSQLNPAYICITCFLRFSVNIYVLAATVLHHSYLIDVLTIQKNREWGKNILRSNDKKDKLKNKRGE